MTASINAQLEQLYGDSAVEMAAELMELMKLVRPQIPASLTKSRQLPTRDDAILITYADQIRKPDEAPLRSLAEFARRHLAGMISSIHLLPFYPSSSDDGFSVMDYLAVDPDFGTWDEIREMGRSFDLMFDAVFNHASAQGDWFRRFLDQDAGWETAFYTIDGEVDLSQVVRPRTHPVLTEFQTRVGRRRVWTTFSADQVDLNYEDPRVALRVIAVLLEYIKSGARWIRLDAIAYLWKCPGTTCIHLPETHAFIQLLRSVLDEVAPAVQLITETNVPHIDNISYFGDGQNEAQLVYNFALPPLVLHTFRTGNAERLKAWAHELELPGDQVTFFNFLASHDGIGVNPAKSLLDQSEIDALVELAEAHGGFVSKKSNPDGTTSPYELNINYADALTSPSECDETRVDRLLAAHSILLAFRGVPGIYFHSLFGSRGDRAGAEISGIARRINRQKLALVDLERDLTNPTSLRTRVFAGISAMLDCRRQCAAFDPISPQSILQSPPEIFAILRGKVGQPHAAVCAVNASAFPAECNLPPGDWNFLLHSTGGLITGNRLILRPFGFAWLG